ncbi:hypothetical protein SRHO_G00084830 [Serrasalmus rhombeus]
MIPLVEQCLQMEDCVHLVCESLGVCEDDEVNVEKVCVLYQKVFLIPANLDDTQRAITQVSAQNAGLPCSGRSVLHVLLLMEEERESREKLYWELQMLKSGRNSTSAGMKSQLLLQNSGSKEHMKQDANLCSSLLSKSRRIYMRLHLDGVCSIFSSLSHGHIAARPLGWISPTSSDILLLLQYKYEIIKERLYREMLQEEHGLVWWDTLTSQEQVDCMCELGEAAETAFKQMDFVRVCELPGALRCYRSSGQVVLQGCGEAVKPREQAWSSKPQEQAWSAAVFFSDLKSHYQDERDSLTVLLNRVERVVLREIYLSLCVAVRRAEREMHSHTALLASRQYWDKWPHTRGSVVLQYLVLCQEQERKSLLEILHTLSLNELQDQDHGLPSAYKAAERTAATLKQSCVSSLKEIKASMQGVSWPDCAVHLLAQLTVAHEHEIWTVLRSLPVMESSGITALLHKYESELHSPKLHNLHDLLQPQASRDTITLTDGESTEQRQSDPSESETQAHCSGCGVVLVPEDAPYLEILGIRNQRDEGNTDRREGGGEEERREGRENEGKEGPDMGIDGVAKSREEEKEEWREGAGERREEGKEMSEGTEAKEVEISLEKQGSLITLAWSKPADAAGKDQEMSAAPAVEEPVVISTDLHAQISTQQVHGDPIMTHDEERRHTHPEESGSTSFQLQEQANTEHPEHTQTVEEHTFVQALQDDSTSSMDAEREGRVADGHTAHPTVSELDLEDSHAAAQPSEAVGIESACEDQDSELVCGGKEEHVDVCEEQQLQREATMRSLVHIQRTAERRWQRDRDRQLLRVQERLSIIQNRKSDEDLLGLTQEDTFRHLTSTIQQEDEQHQKTLVREKLQQLRRERSYILQSRRERNTAGFKELLAPTAQQMTNAEDVL